jgi:hypothetical protein
MRSNSAATILRWGLAFVFFYVAIAALRAPSVWAGYVPNIFGFVPSNIFISAFSLFAFVLAVWLFWGKQLVWSSVIAAIALAIVIIVKLSDLDLVFPTIGLFFSSLALFNLAHEQGFKDELGED